MGREARLRKATPAVTEDRWRVAQEAEQRYWDFLRSDDSEFVRILAEKVQVASWVTDVLRAGLPDGDWLEIGIGPLGVGCIHFLPGAHRRELVGIDPLALLRADQTRLTTPLAAAVAACQGANYRHITSTGEETRLPEQYFGLVVCYNVLDHVRDPAAVLQQAHRVLRPGGVLVLGCDTVSVASIAKFNLYVKRRDKDSIGVLAHPFRFRARRLVALVQASGFRVLHENRRRPSWFHELTGDAHRLLLIGERVPGASESPR